MKKLFMATVLMAGMMVVDTCFAQEAAAPAAPAAAEGGQLQANTEGGAPVSKKKDDSGFIDVIKGGGWLGVVLWLALFACGAFSIYFIVDSAIMVKPNKIMPAKMINDVKSAMAEGDVMKALKVCENEPGPMANILSAGFSHVEEGFDVIQDSIGAAADLETERIMQHLNWISVCANLAPMLGLLGTVQGMIMCFKTLATGAPDVGHLPGAVDDGRRSGGRDSLRGVLLQHPQQGQPPDSPHAGDDDGADQRPAQRGSRRVVRGKWR